MSVRMAKRPTTSPLQDVGQLLGNQAIDDRRPERHGADRGADRRRADVDDDRGSDASNDDRCGERQLDIAQHLKWGQPHAFGRLTDRAGHAFKSGNGVLDDRQQAVKDQRNQRRQGPEPGHRYCNGQHGCRGEGLADRCKRVGDGAKVAAGRARDEDAKADACDRRDQARSADQCGLGE